MSGDISLTRLPAREAVQLLEVGEVSPLELIDAALARIEQVEPEVNALPTLCPDRAREQAKLLPMRPEGGRGWLAGLPVAITLAWRVIFSMGQSHQAILSSVAMSSSLWR